MLNTGFDLQVLLDKTPHRTNRIHSFKMPIGGSFDPHPDPQFKQVNPKWKFAKTFKMSDTYLIVPFEDLEVDKWLHICSYVY